MDGLFSNQYFGSPMTCELKGKPDAEFSIHCWKHGTYLIEDPHILKNAKCLPENQYPLKKVRIRIITLLYITLF